MTAIKCNKSKILTIFVIYCAAVCCALYLPNTLEVLDSDEIKYRDYIEELISFTNLTADPCDDFKHFACGRLTAEKRRPSIVKINQFDVVKRFIFDAKNKSAVEEKLFNIYLTCEQKHNLTDMFEQIDSLRGLSAWPLSSEPTLKDIARILGELSSFDAGIFRFVISQGTLYPIHDTKVYSSYDIEAIMGQVNVGNAGEKDAEAMHSAAAEIVQLSEVIYNFTISSKYSETKEQMINASSIDDLKQLIPNFEWNSYFEGLFNLLNIPLSESAKYIKRVANIELARDIVQLLNTYDKRVIMNKLVYRYVRFLSSFECNDLLPFFRPPLLKRIWDEVLTDDVKTIQLQFLNNFMDMLQEITRVTGHHSIDDIMKLITIRKHIILNHKNILNDNLIDEYYSSLKVDSKNFYLNYLKLSIYLLEILQPKLKEFNRNFNDTSRADTALQNDLINVFEGEYDHIINPNLKDKPSLYHFTTDNIYLWHKFFEHNPVWRNYTVAEECLSQQNEDRSYLENTSYMDAFASNRVTFLEFLEYLEENGRKLQNIRKMIQSMGLDNLQQIYFISLYQNVCHLGRKTAETTLTRVLKHSERFMETFQCPGSAKMNRLSGKICHIRECTSYEGKFVLRPYIFPKCSPLSRNRRVGNRN